MEMMRGLTGIGLVVSLVLSIFVSANALPKELVPVGSTVGIEMETEGVVVVDYTDKKTSPGKMVGLRKGDVIVSIDGVMIEDGAHFQSLIDACNGETLPMMIRREGESIPIVLPCQVDGNFQMGIYIRDSMAGIGTVTFYDPISGIYGALGHGINDAQSSLLLPLECGTIIPSSVVDVQKSTRGTPGLLKGSFDTTVNLGTVEENTNHGIFGHVENTISTNESVSVATKCEIKTGKVEIYSNLSDDEVVVYEAEIEKIFPLEENSGRNMLLRITDPRLLTMTGGVVQGMSGSPILQNGKLIGAVTHVLVNDPTRGYGIFIENMLEASESIEHSD